MATPEQHIDQWRHNRQFLCLIPREYPDWMVTVAFYTAVQAIDTLLAADGLTVNNHDERKRALILTNRYQQISRHFLPLYDLCRTVRYLATPAQWTPAEKIKPNVIIGLLYPIENSVIKLTGRTLDLPAITLTTETPAS